MIPVRAAAEKNIRSVAERECNRVLTEIRPVLSELKDRVEKMRGYL